MNGHSKYVRHWQRLAPPGMDLAGRVRWVLDNRVGHFGRFPALEDATGINQRAWKSVAYGANKPAPRIVDALARLKPELASWLRTGAASGDGQINPELRWNASTRD